MCPGRGYASRSLVAVANFFFYYSVIFIVIVIRVNNKLLMDEELLRGRAAAKKAGKSTPDFSLPYVPGGKRNQIYWRERD